MPGLAQRLRDMFLGGKLADSNGTAPALKMKIRCDQCGEEITTRVEKAHALQEQYESTEGEESEEPKLSGYLLQKELLGEKCQQIIRLTMHFDAATRLLGHEIEGGELLEVTDSE